MKCPNPECGAEVEAGNKHCTKCGTQIPESPKAPSGQGLQIGEKAMVTGEVVGGDKTEIKTHGGDAHVHHHKNIDETKKTRTCCVSNRIVQITEMAQCKSCEGYALKEYVDNKVCQNCRDAEASKNEKTFTDKLKEFLDNDKIIDKEERGAIEEQAKQLGISESRAAELEAIARQKWGVGKDRIASRLTGSSKMALAKGRSALLENLDFDSASQILQPLFNSHPENEEVAYLYILTCLEKIPQEALNAIKQSSVYRGESAEKSVLEIEAYEQMGQKDKAEEVEGLGIESFRDNVLLRAKELERCIDQYFKPPKAKEEYAIIIEVAEGWSAEEGEKPHWNAYLSFVDDYLKYAKGEKKDLFDSVGDASNYYLYYRELKKRYLNKIREGNETDNLQKIVDGWYELDRGESPQKQKQPVSGASRVIIPDGPVWSASGWRRAVESADTVAFGADRIDDDSEINTPSPEQTSASFLDPMEDAGNVHPAKVTKIKIDAIKNAKLNPDKAFIKRAISDIIHLGASITIEHRGLIGELKFRVVRESETKSNLFLSYRKDDEIYFSEDPISKKTVLEYIEKTKNDVQWFNEIDWITDEEYEKYKKGLNYTFIEALFISFIIGLVISLIPLLRSQVNNISDFLGWFSRASLCGSLLIVILHSNKQRKIPLQVFFLLLLIEVFIFW